MRARLRWATLSYAGYGTGLRGAVERVEHRVPPHGLTCYSHINVPRRLRSFTFSLISSPNLPPSPRSIPHFIAACKPTTNTRIGVCLCHSSGVAWHGGAWRGHGRTRIRPADDRTPNVLVPRSSFSVISVLIDMEIRGVVVQVGSGRGGASVAWRGGPWRGGAVGRSVAGRGVAKRGDASSCQNFSLH